MTVNIINHNSIHSNIDISVIIPTYNRIAMVQEAIESVLAQDFKGTVELIVIDDNSSDDTVKMITQTYPEVQLIHFSQNQGVYVARNQSLKIAKGKYIAFLDSDDIWKKNYLSSQILALENNHKNISVSAATIWNKETNEKIVVLQEPNLGRFTSPIHQLLVSSSFIHSPSLVVLRRELFEKIGLFDELFKVGADREFYARCYIHGYQPIFIEEPLVLIRKHNQGQLTDFDLGKIELRKQSRLKYLERLYPLIEQQNLEHLPINRLYAEIYSTSAREFYREKYYIHWLQSWIEVAKYMSIQYAALNMLRDLFRFTKYYLPKPILRMIKTLFISKSLST